jgi:redox-regulated HSP33 family molecular chaperone
MVALKAIESKNVQGLLDAGEGIDEACENCHKQYWYPNEKSPDKKS